ncbi:transposase [Aquimarina sp. RZ0]|uniref:transposase n=1 Tax=Aquimarina sp. RZ0 TaxID=2607730 RepID=UPI0011F1AA88|nr:transposase [Aquimarina sp. RZ0]KAA1246294.1 transposase [Aquimarina sp. RZ0]
MIHKLRSAMGLWDDEIYIKGRNRTGGMFFETVSITRDKSEPLKRVRGSQRQTTVLVSVESRDAGESHDPKKHGKKKKVGYIKMKAVESLKKECITQKVTKSVEKNTKIEADRSTSYMDLEKDSEMESKVIPKKDAVKVLPMGAYCYKQCHKVVLICTP